MANLTPKKIDLSTINGGVEYTVNDGVQPETINGVIGASAYAQSLATNVPDTTLANLVGVPSVEIKEKTDGTPYLVFKYLKGDSGLANGTLFNSAGESATDGYSQLFTNSLVSNPNLLINPFFTVNQRGQSSYTGKDIYTADRWYMWSYTGKFDVATKTLTAQGGGATYLAQFIENKDLIAGKTVSISAKIDGVVYSATGTLPTTIANNTTSYVYVNYGNGYVRIRGSKDLSTFRFEIGANEGKSVIIEWAKLEISPVATACVPRPIAEETLLCQRYYQKLSVPTKGNLLFNDLQRAYVTVPKMAETRILGTATLSGTLNIGQATHLAFDVSIVGKNYIILVHSGTPFTGIQEYYTDTTIAIDAEIY